MNRTLAAVLALGMVLVLAAPAAPAKVVNENTNQLPPGCDEIQGEEEFTVNGGRDHAAEFNGAVFTFDERSIEIDPCTRVTVTFVNEDNIRHQFMVHGTYPFDPGFFMIELTGAGQETGTFITPAEQASLLVHCGVLQHQQKGMKGQILVDGGLGDIPNIVGVSGTPSGDAETQQEVMIPSLPVLHVLALLAAVTLALRPRTST